MPQTVAQSKALRLFLRSCKIKDLKQFLNGGGAADVDIYSDPSTLAAYVTEAEYHGTETLEQVHKHACWLLVYKQLHIGSYCCAVLRS